MVGRNDVAVLIPTYNRSDLLKESIASVLAQTMRPAEIVVVDDGSSDDTGAVVQGYGDAVRYLPQMNAGKAAAINAGLSATRSQRILVLDDDDLLPPSAIADHCEVLDQDDEAGFSYGRYSRFRPGGVRPEDSRDLEPMDLTDQRRLFLQLIEHDFLPNPSWLVRRSVMNQIGPYSAELKRSQDFEMILRLSRRFRGAAVPSVVLYQREHEAARGHGVERQRTTHTIGLWVKYDAIMMEMIDRSSSDEDYRPFEDEAVPHETLALQRGVSNFQRNNFDSALGHLARYASAAGARQPTGLEAAIGARLLAASHGLGTAMGTEPSVAQRLKALGLHPELRRAMASQSAWRFKSAMASGRISEAFALWRFASAAFATNPVEAARHRQGPYPRQGRG